MPRACAALSTVVLTAALAGCGEQRTQPPDPRVPVAPAGLKLERFPRAGVSFTQPVNWDLRRGRAPLVATVSSSRAVVSLWRYPRIEPLPSGHAELEQARMALIAAARARDPSLALRQSTLSHLAGFDAIVLVGRETVGSERREVISVHIFAYGAEVVFDALVPFARVQSLLRTVFGPMLYSLRLTRPRGYLGPRAPRVGATP